MSVARAINDGMRADRTRDLWRAMNGHWGFEHRERITAWCWWGWSLRVDGKGSLGYPGAELGQR